MKQKDILNKELSVFYCVCVFPNNRVQFSSQFELLTKFSGRFKYLD